MLSDHQRAGSGEGSLLPGLLCLSSLLSSFASEHISGESTAQLFTAAAAS